MQVESGKELSYLEAEARSDQASIDQIKKERKELHCSGPWDGLGCFFGLKEGQSAVLKSTQAVYESRKKDMEKADQLIKEGKFQEARELAQKSQHAGTYIESALGEFGQSSCQIVK